LSWKSSSGTSIRTVAVKIEPGHDLLESLEKTVDKLGIKTGVILSAVGSLEKGRLRNVKRFPTRFPISKPDRLYSSINGPLEILSLSGNISQNENGKTIIHAHITISHVKDGEVSVLGGHLIEGNITYVMVEIVILDLDIGMQRKLHPIRKAMELSFT
jgi:predicted DNA-binding protein with PD1-like motif